eukprot:UN31400
MPNRQSVVLDVDEEKLEFTVCPYIQPNDTKEELFFQYIQNQNHYISIESNQSSVRSYINFKRLDEIEHAHDPTIFVAVDNGIPILYHIIEKYKHRPIIVYLFCRTEKWDGVYKKQWDDISDSLCACKYLSYDENHII